MAYPISEDKKIQKLTNLLVKYAEKEGADFSFGGNEFYPVETFSFFGCMPLFLIEAKENYEKIYNNLYTVEELMAGIGRKVTKISDADLAKEKEWLNEQEIKKEFPIEFFEKEEDTFFGFIPKTSKAESADFITLAFFTQYAVENYIKTYKNNELLLVDGKIPLEPLYEKMVTKINNKEIKIIPTSSVDKNIKDKS